MNIFYLRVILSMCVPGNIHGCIKYFKEGLENAFKPLSDPRLYFHYGDALARIGRKSDAMKVNEIVIHCKFETILFALMNNFL